MPMRRPTRTVRKPADSKVYQAMGITRLWVIEVWGFFDGRNKPIGRRFLQDSTKIEFGFATNCLTFKTLNQAETYLEKVKVAVYRQSVVTKVFMSQLTYQESLRKKKQELRRLANQRWGLRMWVPVHICADMYDDENMPNEAKILRFDTLSKN